MTSTVDNSRIAKNTVLLYIRTFLVMLVTFYTSRVILKILGVEDYGIFQVAGGIVAMFSIISGALSVSISRYITFEIGTGNQKKLRAIFSTSVIIQIILALAILILSEYPAIWFVKHKMTLPPHMISTTIWVLQFSLISFCVNLISIPYTACIIAHEKMKAYAYISIIDVLMRLGICYAIILSPFGRLISYSALMALTAIIIRVIYTVYCNRNFEECRGKTVFEKELFKELMSFSGWSFFSNSASIVNQQGVTMLMNVYFGLMVNTARGLATQVETGVLQFVNNFTTAVNPQITKSYATGQLNDTYKLVCRGAKFSSFAMYLFAIPLIFEMHQVLGFWLGEVPYHTVKFAQLSLVMGLLDCMGSSGYTACIATGNLKKYALVITPIGYIEFLGTWLLFKFGAPVVSTYYLFIAVKTAVNIARMFLLKSMIGLPIQMYINHVFRPVIIVATLSIVVPLIVTFSLQESILRIILTVILTLISVGINVFFLGMSSSEKIMARSKLSAIISKLRK